jgi:hypothetical protein
MNDALSLLAVAIADVGWWWSWRQSQECFDVLFGGTQLWTPPSEEGWPPPGAIALSFQRPKSVSFLTHRDAAAQSCCAPAGAIGYPTHLGEDWPALLRRGALPGVLHFSGHCLTFADRSLQRQVLSEASRIDTVVGRAPGAEEFFDLPAWMAFWAGPAGLVVGAERMVILDRGQEVPLDRVAERSRHWWRYWKEYWRRKGTERALPEDYACERTIDPLSEAGRLAIRRIVGGIRKREQQ